MTYLDPNQSTILDRLQAGFLSESPEGKKQLFFAKYDSWRMSDNDDAHEIQRLEHEAGITQADWQEYHASFRTEF